MYFTYNKGFFHYASHLAKNQYNADQIFEKSRKIRALVWPLWNSDFSFTDQKDLKLGQCLDMDDMTSPSKFGEVTWPSSHFMDRSVF